MLLTREEILISSKSKTQGVYFLFFKDEIIYIGKSINIYKRIYAHKMLMRLPVCMDWVEYKGDDVVVQWNFEATEKAKKPMVDVSYCMTKALNQVILKTVQWDKNKFKPSRLGNAKW